MTFNVYFAAGEKTAKGTSLSNRYSVIHAKDELAALDQKVKLWPGIKSYLFPLSSSTHIKFNWKFIESEEKV